MEELRSTEILDKEIEADARKKAERILAKADEEIKTILDAVETRVKEASDQKEAFYAAKYNQIEKNLEASVPLEKERFLVSYYAECVSDAFNEYLENLGQKKRLELIGSRLVHFKDVLADKKLNAAVFGFAVSDAKKLLEKNIGKNLLSVSEISFEKSGEEVYFGNAVHEGIVLESEDKFFKIRLTIDEIVRETLDEHNEELTKALFGGRLPE